MIAGSPQVFEKGLNMKAVRLSAFGDEAAKQPHSMFSALAAMGLQFYSPRFFDFGEGPVNAMKLTPEQLRAIVAMQAEFGIRAATLGSPVGKSKLVDKDDGNKAPFMTLEQVLEQLERALSLCAAFETNLLRAFSFYPPHGEDPQHYLEQAAEYVGRCVERCDAAGVVYGMEVEANLVGRNADLLVEICRKVGSRRLKLVWDGGNQSSQGYLRQECVRQFQTMLPYLGWMHVKDYDGPMPAVVGQVHEDSLKHFVTPDVGKSGYDSVFSMIAADHDAILGRLKACGIEQLLVELEPHVKGGGQFGGYSGPDGLGLACRTTVNMLQIAGLTPELIDFVEIQRRRGF